MAFFSSICVAGGGSWGTSLAHHLTACGHDVVLWLRNARIAEAINSVHENPRYLAGFALHKKLTATTETSALAREILVSTVPCQQLRAWLDAHKGCFLKNTVFVNAAKGIEIDTLSLGHIIAEKTLSGTAMKSSLPARYAVLSGPSFAVEVIKGLPTAVVLACLDDSLARRLQEIFSDAAFRCYTSTDVTGVEMGGALKNVMAIAAGLCDGLELGFNGRAALITRGLAEMSRLGIACGAQEHTFMGLSGLGDLVLTCTGKLSRNRQVGFALGRGEDLESILRKLGMTAEGVKTAAAAQALADRLQIDAPIINAVYNIIYKGHNPLSAVTKLMERALKEERISGC
jgi:glycerol-3-phosphate dehydrogenase (NAD(P)+)